MRIAAVVVALSAGVAAAEPPGMTPTVEPPGMTPILEPPAVPLEPSYRWQTAAADGAAVGFILLAASSHSEGLADAGLGTYLIGAPAIHFSHHRPGRAAGSLALRVGLPILGAVIGAKAHDNSCSGVSTDLCDDGPAAEAFVGVLAGMVAASVIDTAFLAKGDDAPARASWSPTVSAGHSGFALGVSGAF